MTDPGHRTDSALSSSDKSVDTLVQPDGARTPSMSAKNINLNFGGKPPSADAEPPSEVPNQHEKPYSIYTTRQKRAIVLCGAACAFFAPLTAQIYLPSLPAIAESLDVTYTEVTLTVTVYMILQGIAPLFVSPIADQAGRRPAFLICFMIYIAGNIGCAVAPTYEALLGLRALQSAGASSTLSLCQAVVSDIVTSAERGGYVAWTALPVILAPAIGPVIGGVFAQYASWRSIFYFLTAAASVLLIWLFLYFPETCRNITGDGSILPPIFYRPVLQLFKQTKEVRSHKKAGEEFDLKTMGGQEKKAGKDIKVPFPNPFRCLLLLLEPEMFLLLTYAAIVNSGFFAVAAAMPDQLSKAYGLNSIETGLMYLPMGVGSMMAAVVMGRVQNNQFAKACQRAGIPFSRTQQADLSDFPIEKVRLRVCVIMVPLYSICLIGWGWAFEEGTSIAVPAVLLFFIGISMTAFTNATNILTVDINPGIAGAAAATSNFVRCLLGAIMSAMITPMYTAMGQGWAYTTLGLIYVVLMPMMFAVMRRGIMWRKKKMARRQARMRKLMEKQRAKAEQHAARAARLRAAQEPIAFVTTAPPILRQPSTGAELKDDHYIAAWADPNKRTTQILDEEFDPYEMHAEPVPAIPSQYMYPPGAYNGGHYPGDQPLPLSVRNPAQHGTAMLGETSSPI